MVIKSKRTNLIHIKKEKAWEKQRAVVERITDGLGRRVDNGIKECVIALRMYGFPTSASCEGHLASHTPWVEIYAPEPQGRAKKKEKEHMWRRENLKERKRMLEILKEFYQRRKVPLDTMLYLERLGIFGGFIIQSMGAETIEMFPREKRKKKIREYRKEMDDFTRFLRDKFFREN